MNDNLTPRELDIIKLVALGRTNKQVARDLRITPETTKNNLKMIFQKLQANNRTHAVFLFSGMNGFGGYDD